MIDYFSLNLPEKTEFKLIIYTNKILQYCYIIIILHTVVLNLFVIKVFSH